MPHWAKRRMTRNTDGATPGTFAFRLPDMPEVAEMPELRKLRNYRTMPSIEFDGNVMYAGHSRLGIDGEDLSGQLGTIFGAPEGEGSWCAR